MIHHDSRPYEVAVSEAAKSFQEKLEGMIHGSVERVTRVIEQVQNDVPQDSIVAGKNLRFGVAAEQDLVIAVDGAEKTIHNHALMQIAERPKIKNFGSVIRELNGRGEWGRNLIAHNLNEVYAHMNGDRYLLRSVGSQLRGFLSNSYRRLDSRPLADAFIGEVQRFGARPIDGFALQTKMRIRAILPMVFEPFAGEVMAFGAELSDSDFGDGALSLSGILLRMWCTNLATTEDVLTKVHLGKRMEDVRFSQTTYELDTKTMASAIHDLTANVLSAPAVNGYLDVIKKANDEKVDPKQMDAWLKKNLTKEEAKTAAEKFTSLDTELLPPGQTMWRFSNALSWLANETADERRKLELQDFAGAVLRDKKAA